MSISAIEFIFLYVPQYLPFLICCSCLFFSFILFFGYFRRLFVLVLLNLLPIQWTPSPGSSFSLPATSLLQQRAQEVRAQKINWQNYLQ